MVIEDTPPITLQDLAEAWTGLLRVEERGERIVALHRFQNRLDAVTAQEVARFDRDRGYASVGALSMTAWLRSTCHLSGNEAGKVLCAGRRLEELPAIRQSFERGDISLTHASTIARTVDKVGNQLNPDYDGEPGEPRNVEESLLASAEQFEPRDLTRVCKRLELCLDPDGSLRDWGRQEARQYLECSEALDGMLHLQGLLAPEGAAVVRSALEAATAPRSADDRRGASERRAEALVEVCRIGLDAGRLPTHQGERPHLDLIVDYRSLRGEPGEPAILDRNGIPVPGKVAERIACDCQVRPVVSGENGDVLHVGRTQRLFTPKQSLALALRDRHCVFPGCDRPPWWCANHHLVHWLHGGSTDLENAGKLCKRHHSLCHEGGWTLRRNPETGAFTALPPP